MRACLTYVVFTSCCVVAPGYALQRLLGLRPDPHLVPALGLLACAAAYAASLVSGASWLFPWLLGAVLVAAATRAWRDRRARRRPEPLAGPNLRGAWPALLAVLLFLGLTAFQFNRQDRDGAFLLDPVERIDQAFQVGLAWELVHGYPPQVPGLAGQVLDYHLGQHLVRAAAVRWAGLAPYDVLTRFDLALAALALVLALRALAWQLGARGLGLSLAGFIPLAGDLSWLFAGRADWPTDLLASNLHMALTFGNSLVAALALAAAGLTAWARYLSHRGRGVLLLAVLLLVATPFFKVFLAPPLCLGLLWAAWRTGRRSAWLLAATLGATGAALALGPGVGTVELRIEWLVPFARAAESLGWDVESPGRLALWSLLAFVLALGLRGWGLPAAWRALWAGPPLACALAGAVVTSLVAALSLRMTYEGEGQAYNEAVYFFTLGMALLWLFAVLRLGARERDRQAPVVAVLAALAALPTAVHFAWQRLRVTPERVPAHVLRVVAALQEHSRPGEVVIHPTQLRFPPLGMVLLGRRAPFTRFIPYMSQFAAPQAVARRRAALEEFFATSDPQQALRIAQELGARHVLLYGPQRLGFDGNGVAEVLAQEGNARLLRLGPTAGGGGPELRGTRR